LLVNFIYTACFQVCPTTTKNLQKAVPKTRSASCSGRSLQHRQHRLQPALRFARGDEGLCRSYGIHLPNWEFLSPATAIVADVTQNFGFSYVATTAGFDHLNQITLVDAEGSIVRQVYGENFTPKDIAEPLKR
jgi:protein SCO1/2